MDEFQSYASLRTDVPYRSVRTRRRHPMGVDDVQCSIKDELPAELEEVSGVTEGHDGRSF